MKPQNFLRKTICVDRVYLRLKKFTGKKIKASISKICSNQRQNPTAKNLEKTQPLTTLSFSLSLCTLCLCGSNKKKTRQCRVSKLIEKLTPSQVKTYIARQFHGNDRLQSFLTPITSLLTYPLRSDFPE